MFGGGRGHQVKKAAPVKGQGRWTAPGYELRGAGKLSDGQEGQAGAGRPSWGRRKRNREDGKDSKQDPMSLVKF